MSSQWAGGKGSARRPENKEKFDENYDKIFRKKDYNKLEDEDLQSLQKVIDEHPIRGK